MEAMVSEVRGLGSGEVSEAAGVMFLSLFCLHVCRKTCRSEHVCGSLGQKSRSSLMVFQPHSLRQGL